MQNYRKDNFGGKNIYQVYFNSLLDFLKVKYIYIVYARRFFFSDWIINISFYG